ncbi:hypothetical protein ACJJIL_07810 [Microbulbifer sp. EKSA005]|uniref:hypothetical protein n=1 Tax=Microbulbifer sp. EKSA005 TaxID=3243364 RepID=UPI0040422CA4
MGLTVKLALVLVVLAVLILVYATVSYKKYKWIAVEYPVDVTKKGRSEFNFRSQLSGPYELELQTERVLDFREQNCRLGIQFLDKENSKDHPEALAIDWAILGEGVEVAVGKSGDKASGFWGSTMGKTLHVFETIKGRNYTILASVIEPDPALGVTDPVLKVVIDRIEHKSAVIYFGLLNLTSFLLIVIAAAICFSGLTTGVEGKNTPHSRHAVNTSL